MALRLFIPLTKYNAETGEISGTLALEEVDKSKEIMDYEGSRPYFQKWSDEFTKATGGQSCGNMRAMHQPIAAGKFTSIIFDDAKKVINVEGVVVDPVEKLKCETGVYTGFSLGGGYVKRWSDPAVPGVTRYIANPSEGSLVDNPCMYGATFSKIGRDGAEAVVKFVGGIVPKEEVPTNRRDPEVTQGWQAKDGSFHLTKVLAETHNAEVDAVAATATLVDPAQAALNRLEAAVTKAEAPPAKGKDKPEADMTDEEKAAAEEKKKKDATDAKAAADKKKAAKKYATLEALAKGMYTITQMANILRDIKCLSTDYAAEQFYEGDDTAGPLIASLQSWLSDGVAVLEQVVAMETAELKESGEDENVAVVEMCATGEFGKAIKTAKTELADALRKAGARNSKGDATRIQNMHDLTAELGAACTKDNCAEEAAKVEHTQELAKIAGERDTLAKSLEDFTTLATTLAERIEKLERQPAAGGPVVLVTKSQDNGSEPVDLDPVAAIMKSIESMPADQRAHELMKIALRFPQNVGDPRRSSP